MVKAYGYFCRSEVKLIEMSNCDCFNVTASLVKILISVINMALV